MLIKTIKYVENVVRSGNGFMLEVPLNVELHVIYNSFITINN